jgi:hypothetical protein
MKNRRALRAQIVALLQEGDFPALVKLAGRESGVAAQLLLFLFAPHELLHWRAVEGLGYVAGAYPPQVQRLLGRLLYLLNEDSGSFGWGAAAALGEIGRHQISLVAEIIPMFCGFLEEEFSQGPMLWGLGRLGEAHPELLSEALPLITSSLGHGDPQIRALAAWCLGRVRHREAAPALQALLDDHGPARLYDRGELRQTTVAQVAREALAALDQESAAPLKG